MARQWTPCFVVTTDLYGKAEVGIIAGLLKLSRFDVVGRLVRFWIEAQRKADDRGLLPGRLELVDAITDCPGFGRAMCDAGWLSVYGDGLLVPRFRERISREAVGRTLNNVRRQRAKFDAEADIDGGLAVATRGPGGGQSPVAPVQPNLPGIESKKPRKAKGVKVADPNFWRFWKAYPKQWNQPAAAEAWAELNPDAGLVDTMLAAIEAWKQSPQWTKRGTNGEDFIPAPANWLAGRRWQDPISPGAGGHVQSGARVRSGGGEYGRKRSYPAAPDGPVHPKADPGLFDAQAEEPGDDP